MSNNVSLLINGKEFVFWTDVSITRAIDQVDSIEFGAPFDHEAPGFKETFAPFSFNPIQINIDGAPLFTGTMIDVAPDIGESRTISVNGYATAGVLGDCTAPVAAMPLEFNKLTLKDISERLAGFFNVGVEFKGDPGAPFDRVACDPDRKVLDFLADLAKQRGFVISSNAAGGLLFWKSEGGAIVARLKQGASPLTDIKPDFSPQDYYSELTGLAAEEVDRAGSKTTVKTRAKMTPEEKKRRRDARKGLKGAERDAVNAKFASEDAAKRAATKATQKKNKPAKKYNKFSVGADEAEVFRPLTFKITDADGKDAETATRAKLARMLGNMATYTLDVDTWRDANGAIWAPNTRIQIEAPDAMIYGQYTFEVKSVRLNQSENSETATISLALPGSFSGEPPEVYPWEL